VRDDEFGARVFESADQFDGVLDALAKHDAGGLQDEPVVFFEADFPAQDAVVVVELLRRFASIQLVRTNRRANR
jgi:hypothetical protein